jgi:hypothetical protein
MKITEQIQVWWHIPIISAFRRQRQELHEFRPALATK